MSKIDVTYTPEEIEYYASLDRVIASNSSGNNDRSEDFEVTSATPSIPYYQCSVRNLGSDGSAYFYYSNPITMSRFNNDGASDRICGYVIADNADGSHQLALLGNGNRLHIKKEFQVISGYKINVGVYSVGVIQDYLIQDTTELPLEFVTSTNNRGFYTSGEIYGSGVISPLESFDYHPTWLSPANNCNTFFKSNCRQNDVKITSGYGGDLTLNQRTTLNMGYPFGCIYIPLKNTFIDGGYANVGGDLNFIGASAMGTYRSGMANAPYQGFFTITDGDPTQNAKAVFGGLETELGTYAFCWKPFNIVLTRNIDEARRYVTDGILPSDAWLYPIDPDDLPLNYDGVHPDPEGSTPPENPNDEGGDINDDTEPTPTGEPNNTAQVLTNTNLYALTSAQLKEFIDWFWTDATDVQSVGDLLDKIRGLYENLAEALLSIRFMPINFSWVGGTSLANSIIVGMLEKEGQVLTINKTVAPLRNIGVFDIREEYKAFTDYSPYVNISLFLPFHGFIDLDTDILMNHKIAVQCTYDIMSGTIQYFIFRDGYGGEVINMCVAKMCIDIPITLQTKTQRDSATYSNIASVTGNLIGAGTSAVSGNPIGLTMAMAGFAGTQTQGAGMSIKGNVGESGGLYQPTKCAIYIKRPTYNRPKNAYAQHVGYPCNQTYNLSKGMGYTQVYNPYIHFSGNNYTDDTTHETYNNKPLESEVEEIYNMMEKGVIL